jgi:hypothetical protein
MTDLRQAATLALEALRGADAIDTDMQDAIYTLYEALEQPEQGPTCPECKAAVLYECVACSSNNYPPKPEQEPVGSLSVWYHLGSKSMTNVNFDYNGDLPEGDYELYTTPPPRSTAPVGRADERGA